jgi:hypothetical protein
VTTAASIPAIKHGTPTSGQNAAGMRFSLFGTWTVEVLRWVSHSKVSSEEVPYMRAVSVTYEMTALVAVTVQTALHNALAAVFARLPLC